MTIDLRAASVRPAGTEGIAARTAGGFIVVTGVESIELVSFLDEHQSDSDVVEQMAARIREIDPAAFAMLFTAQSTPHILAWGEAVVTVSSPGSRFTITPVNQELLVHALSIDESSTVVLSSGSLDGDLQAEAINLAEGSMRAQAVVVGLGGTPADAGSDAAILPALGLDSVADPGMVERTALIPARPPGLAQPAAEEIVFAEDLEAIEDLIEAAVPPPMPETGAIAEVPPEFLRDAAEAIPQTNAKITAPLPQRSSPASVAPAMVLGVTCPHGHHNHPDTMHCSHCGAMMPASATTILVNGPRPSLGVLVVDDGTTVSLDQDLVIGRDPLSNDDVRAGLATPMTLSDETLALSRQHARIMLDDWSASIVDMQSSNGTWINRGGGAQAWSRVDAAQPIAMKTGDRLRIGGRVVQVELHHAR